MSGRENSTFQTKTGALQVFAVFGATLVLLSMFIPLPLPGFVTGLPWKSEFFGSVFLVLVLISLFVTRRNDLLNALDLSKRNRSSNVFILLIGFATFAAASAVWSQSPRYAFHYALSWIMYLIVALLVAGFRDSKSFSARTAALFVLVISVLCIVDFIGSDFAANEGTLRIRYGRFAELLVTVTPLLWGLAISIKNSRSAMLSMVVGFLGWLTVMLSLSKGAFIAGIAAFSLMFTLTAIFSKRWRKRAIVLAAAWIVFTVGIQVFLSIGTSVPSTTDYISGTADASRTTTTMRLFTWKVAAEMVTNNWVIGVGADNFGLKFNEARKTYGAKHPDDPDNMIAEQYLVERAHNEPLQILAELGIIGILLFMTPFLIFVYYVYRSIRHSEMPPLFYSSLAGMIGFAISSLFSSFSFRAVQNGFAFAIVFGLALRYLPLRNVESPESEETALAGVWPKLVFTSSVFLMCVMFVLSSLTGLSRYYQHLAEYSVETSDKVSCLQTSIYLDPENAGALASFATALAFKGDNAAAAKYLNNAIRSGLGVTQIYSQMAGYQLKAGDVQGSQNSMAEAAAVFPRSVFARARYAQILEINGNLHEAATQRSIAEQIDTKQTGGWVTLLRDGDLAAMYASRIDLNIAAPADLRPEEAVYQFIDWDSIPSPKKAVR